MSGNMSYCRFQNTVSDLNDCHVALVGMEPKQQLSTEEWDAFVEMVAVCGSIYHEYKHLLEEE